MARPIGIGGFEQVTQHNHSLIRECASSDTSLIVQVNPVERPGTPRTAQEILQSRTTTFNATLLKELRMIAMLRQVSDPGDSEGVNGPRWYPPRCERDDDRSWRFLQAQRRVGSS